MINIIGRKYKMKVLGSEDLYDSIQHINDSGILDTLEPPFVMSRVEVLETEKSVDNVES